MDASFDQSGLLVGNDNSYNVIGIHTADNNRDKLKPNWFLAQDSRQFVAYVSTSAILLFVYSLLCIKTIQVMKSKFVKKHER